MPKTNLLSPKTLNSTWVIIAVWTVLSIAEIYRDIMSENIIVRHLNMASHIASLLWIGWLAVLFIFLFVKPTSRFTRFITSREAGPDGSSKRKSSAWLIDLMLCGIFCVLSVFSLFWHKWIPSFAYGEPLYLVNRLINLLLSIGFVIFAYRLSYSGWCQKIGANLPFRIVTLVLCTLWCLYYIANFYFLHWYHNYIYVRRLLVFIFLPLFVYLFLVIIRCILKLRSKSFSEKNSWKNVFLFIFA